MATHSLERERVLRETDPPTARRPAGEAPARVHPLPALTATVTPAPAAPPAQPPVHAAASVEPGRRMEDLVHQYSRLIRVMVARVAKRLPLQVREDIEQRVLISLWKQLRRDQSITHPTTYIYKSAVREAMRVRRREDARGQESLEPDGPVARMAAWDDPHRALDRKEKMGHIKAALEAISPDRRQAVWAHLSGFDVAEIMRRHGWSYHKARNLIARGMADMRRVFEENGWAPVQGAASDRPCSSLALKARAYQAKLHRLQSPRLKR